MRIGTKIGAGFAAMVILTGVLGLAGWLGLDRYAGSVAGSDRIGAIAERVSSANADAITFRATGDEAAVARANAGLQAAREAADGIGAGDLSSEIQRFETAFAELVRAAGEAAGLKAEMQSVAQRLLALAGSIRDAERARYTELAEARRQAQELQSAKFTGAQAAEALARATLTAGRREAVYRATKDQKDAEATQEAIKGMFLAALNLKKLAGDGPEAALAGKLAGSVNDYRKAFDALLDAPPFSGKEVSAGKTLDEVSENIRKLSTAVTGMQVSSYGSARGRAEAADQSLQNANSTMTAALEVVAAVQGLSLAQAEVISSRGSDAARQQAAAAIEKLEQELSRLTATATEQSTRESLSTADEEVAAYRTRFEAMLGTIDQEGRAASAMAQAAHDVDTTVDRSVTAFADSRDADGKLARTVIAASTGGAALLAILVALALVRGITVPIRSMTGVMDRLAADDLDVEVPGRDRKDEIADMARAVQVFKDNAERMRSLEAEKLEADRRAAEEKRRTMAELAGSFEQSVGGVVKSLAGFVTDVRSRAETMTEASEQARQQATSVASSSEEASANVQAVSAAAEELAASVTEIGGQVARAAEMARRASDEARRGDARVQALAQTATRIGDVITLIQDIAEQTNLLALNATIEAARAGEAGKGFAVVASEVKSLASQTAKATEDIRAQIEEIQESSREAVTAIQSIGAAVDELDSMNGAVAAAVEEQSATTNEIARNTQEAAAGSSQVSGAIVEVSSASERTGESAAAVLAMCGELSDAADTLSREVQDFLARIRA